MRSQLRIVCLTSDEYLWALKPFIYLLDNFWSQKQQVIVGGFSYPKFQLPPNVQFVQISGQNYPVERWSDSLITMVNAVRDDHFIFMLEDYWLCRTVDVRGVDACWKYIQDKPEVLRIDLTADRLYAGGKFDVESWGSYDIIETPHGTPYQFSTQAGIWNRGLLLKLLKPGKTGWETEIHTQPPPEMRVLGTRQQPVKYANAMLKGRLLMTEVNKIPDFHRDKVMSFTPQYIKDKAIKDE